MNEDLFRQLLGEMLESEFAEYDDPPKWKFSLKHRRAMKRIFVRYERNAKKLKENTSETAIPIERCKPRFNLKQRLLITLCIIFLMTLLSISAFAIGSSVKSPSVVWAPDFEETIEKMRANPEYYEGIANQVREKARREKVEEELEASSAEKKTPAVVYDPDFEETIEKMRENSGYSPEYFDEVVSACREKGQSETMVAAE